MLWRVIEAEVVPTSRELGISQVVWSPIAQGVLTGKYRPGEQPPEGSRATDDKGGANMIKRWMDDDVLSRVQQLVPLAEEAGLSMAQLAVAWVLQNDNVATAIIGASRPDQVYDNVKAAGVKLADDLLRQDRRGPRAGRRARSGQDARELAQGTRGLGQSQSCVPIPLWGLRRHSETNERFSRSCSARRREVNELRQLRGSIRTAAHL